jgi:hypothetical protein
MTNNHTTAGYGKPTLSRLQMLAQEKVSLDQFSEFPAKNGVKKLMIKNDKHLLKERMNFVKKN